MDRFPRLKPTSLATHFTVDTPPRGFDLLHASDKELQQYCLPHRPDPRQFPAASRMWTRAMSRIKRFVQPPLTVQSNIRGGRSTALVSDDVPASWSGLVVSQNGIAYSEVWGTWVVPSVSVPNGQGGNFFSSMWVGLDDPPGPATLNNPDGTNASLLQAGTEQDASLGYNIINGHSSNYSAWVEWFPGPRVNIGQSSSIAANANQQFPVGPGQVITVHIGAVAGMAPDPTQVFGVISMMNVSSGVAISPIVIAPPTVAFDGSSIPAAAFPSQRAVWILEAPAVAGDPPVVQPLADFGQAVMVSGGAVGRHPGDVKSSVSVTVGENDGGQLIDMGSSENGNLLCFATEDPELTFNYVASI